MQRKLRHRVLFQAPLEDRDALGQRTGEWENKGERWAEVLPLRGREFFAAAAVQQEQSVRVWIRRWDDVNTAWRLTWEGLNYDITSAVRFGNDWTEILAAQGVKDGR
jgi:SPP1 family predicted phage head-tail adaptor